MDVAANQELWPVGRELTTGGGGGGFQRRRILPLLQQFATQGIFIGTSSWKYPGWRGQLYTDDRYVYRGSFSEARLQRLCLAEYAEVFKSVCVDAAYYNFPTEKYLSDLVGLVPPDFLFTFKVTDQITIKRFPSLPRFGDNAGRVNPGFLNAELFRSQFLDVCGPFKSNVGLLIFEFSQFSPAEYERGREFVADLDKFFAVLPKGWSYGVEIRNRSFLHPEYFAVLAKHGVAHVFNSWEDMPPLDQQLAMPNSLTTGFFGARLLLRPGRRYEEAVKLFSPYNQVKDPYPEGRATGARLVRAAREQGRRAYIYVNNRFEGNALTTIAALVEEAGA